MKTREEVLKRFPVLIDVSVHELVLLRHEALKLHDHEFKDAIDFLLKEQHAKDLLDQKEQQIWPTTNKNDLSKKD